MVLHRYFQDIFASLPQNKSLSLPASKQNHLEIDFDKDVPAVTVFSGSEPPLPFANSVVYNADVSSWRRLAAEDKACKAVYEVTLDVQDSNLVFKAGDTIGIIPQNDETDVNAVLTHLDLSAVADCNYKLSLNTSSKGSKVPAHIPNQSSLRHVFTNCVDLRSVLKRDLVIFGCRNPELDFIYKKELEEFVQNGVLKKLCTAFSRVDNCDTKYIQDALKQNSEEIAKLIQCNASIFICGDLKTMAAQVQDTFKQCLVNSGNLQRKLII